MMNNITHISCWYSENNIPVHPLQRGKKAPLNRGWQNAPIPTIAEIKKQAPIWDRNGYGLGMRTGYPLQDGSILLVVDVDIHAGALTTEARLELHQKLSDLGLNPKEPTVITGRCPDSCHYYVASPTILAEKFGASLTLCQSHYVNNSNNPYWKIELLGKGKQVVCPPTRHPDTGNEYTLKNNNIMEIPFPLTQQIENSLTANVKPKSLMADIPSDIMNTLKRHFEPAMQSFLNDDEKVIKRLKNALEYITPDCSYEIWRNIIWAIRSHNIKNGIDIARNWSMQSPKYQSSHFDTVWNSFTLSGGIHEGTLYHIAKEYGWSAPCNKIEHQTLPDNSECPCYRVFEKTIKCGSKNYQPGVWLFVTEKDNDEGIKGTLICSPIHIESVTCDTSENNFGRLLRFINTLNNWRTWSMPMSLLSGTGESVRENLLSMGVSIRNPKLLTQYLNDILPIKKTRCTLQLGWCDNVFVLPDCTYGKHKQHEIIFQSEQKPIEEYTPKGSLDGWRDNISTLAINNPLLIIAICCALSGPLIELCHAESGGLHFYGDSSTGKTTLVQVACSVWGGEKYMRSWRATSNGIEGAATMFNGTLLALDEISECNPAEVGKIIYALGNGYGKQRATKAGTAKAITRWRTSVISSGELTVSAIIGDSGERPKAGQTVRLIDLSAQRTYGAWDDLHNFTTGSSLSEHLKNQSVTNYGHTGREFLKNLTLDEKSFSDRLHNIMGLPEFNIETMTGQAKRVAKRFALLALAGELATDYGITGWSKGTAINALANEFQSWLALQGNEPLEKQQVIEQLRSFIERYSDSCFSDKENNIPHPIIRDRAGWWQDSLSGERTYLFTSPGLQGALRGHDFRHSLDVLRSAGILKLKGTKNTAEPMKINKQTVRVYPVCFPDQLD